MVSIFKAITKPFKKPQANDMRKEMLLDYERELLAQQTAASYHTKLAEFYQEGIARLRADITN